MAPGEVGHRAGRRAVGGERLQPGERGGAGLARDDPDVGEGADGRLGGVVRRR